MASVTSKETDVKQKTPQEKKELSYKRDRRYSYNESARSARTTIPLRKALRNRANRHRQNEALTYTGPGPDVEETDEMESRVHHRAPKNWSKYPDKPLGEVVTRKLQRRAVLDKRHNKQ